jgi:hypothetical protein
MYQRQAAHAVDLRRPRLPRLRHSRGKLGFETFDCDERNLGTYPTQRAAADAIMESAP